MKAPAITVWLVILAAATPARAQAVVTPIVTASVQTTPGFIDLDDAASDSHFGAGVSVSRFTSSWFGVEGTVTFTPSAFSGGDLVDSSRLLIATGNALIAGPARWRVRPHLSAGVGVARVQSDDVARLFSVHESRLAITVGGGAWMWITPRIGVRTKIDFVRTINDVNSAAFETWQPSAGIMIRF